MLRVTVNRRWSAARLGLVMLVVETTAPAPIAGRSRVESVGR